MDDQHDLTDESAQDDDSARREFLKKCGKYTVVVPPVMTLFFTREANAGLAVYKGTDPPGAVKK